MDVMNEKTLEARSETKWPSVNREVAPLVDAMIRDAQALRVNVSQGQLGETLIDCGVRAVGGLEAGRRIGEICLGGLGRVSLEATDPSSSWPFMVTVHTSQPVLACLGSQYAGWSLSADDKGKKYHVLGSGPARALGSTEKLFDELGYRDDADSACLVLEADRAPPAALVEQVAEACKVSTEALTIIYAPTSSLAGTVQIAARCLEVALHKSHELHFPLHHIVDGMATAPLPPPAPGFVAAMGRTNDAIIYGGRVQLYVSGLGEGREGAGRSAAEPQVEGLRQAVRRYFRRREGRLLRHRPHAVQPGQGHRHRAGKRRELRGRPYRHGDPVPLLLLLTPWRPRSSSSASARSGTGAASRAPSAHAGSGRSPSRLRLADCPRKPGPGSPFQASATICRRVRLCCSCLAAASSRSLLYLGVLHALRELGVTVWNDARAIERCVDKSTTTFFLQQAGIPTPWTWTGTGAEAALEIVQEKLAQGCKLVQKPLFGAQGEGLRLISAPDDLAPPEEVNGAFYCRSSSRPQTACIGTGASSSQPAASSRP